MASKRSLKKSGLFLCAAALISLRASVFASDKNITPALSHYIMAVVYDRQGSYDKAIAEYKAALKADPENSSIYVNLASSYIKNNEVLRAIEELQLAIKYNPDAVEPHALLAILYSVQSKSEAANREYEVALQNASKIEPKNPELYKTLGSIYLQEKRYDAAQQMYKRMLELMPDDAQAHFFMADIYEQSHQRALAEEELKKSLAIDPDYSEALNYLGYLYIEDNRNLPAAEAMIKKALEIQPENGAYLDSLGWFYFKKGRISEALRLFERAIILLEDPVIYDHLGDVYLSLGQEDKARQSWERSLKLDAQQEVVKKKLDKLCPQGAKIN